MEFSNGIKKIVVTNHEQLQHPPHISPRARGELKKLTITSLQVSFIKKTISIVH